MRSVLFILAVVCLVLAGLVIGVAKSAFHEEIAVGFVVAASVLFVGSAIVGAIERIEELLREQAELRLVSSIHDLNPREQARH